MLPSDVQRSTMYLHQLNSSIQLKSLQNTHLTTNVDRWCTGARCRREHELGSCHEGGARRLLALCTIVELGSAGVAAFIYTAYEALGGDLRVVNHQVLQQQCKAARQCKVQCSLLLLKRPRCAARQEHQRLNCRLQHAAGSTSHEALEAAYAKCMLYITCN
jgi:hypothetical protein